MGTTRRPQILCVEDEPDTFQMLQVLLPEFDIVPATTKREAIEKIKEDEYSLIFMDYYLPDGTGDDACRLIRLLDIRTPILFITGYSDFSATKAVAVGAQGVLKKASPTFVDELRERSTELAAV